MTRPAPAIISSIAVAAVWACSVCLAAPLPGADVVREGLGERRAELDKMELTPFDHSLWDGLKDWTNGQPLTKANTEGKVVVIYTWAGYLPTAVRPLSLVNRLAERNAEQGLVVVGVHEDRGWEDGKKEADRRKVSFPIARDEGNAFRRALKVDQDPDFYVIDRSGRLRFADIDTGSLDRAVEILLNESTEDASSLLTRMNEARAAEAEAARRSLRLRSRIDLRSLPWVEFEKPSEEAYQNAPWPKKSEPESGRRRSRRGSDPGSASINIDTELTWSPAPPQHTEGRATLVYLFTPDIVSTAARGGHSAVELFQWMDQLQAAHARDLQVIGVMVGPQEDTRRRRNEAPDAGAAAKARENFDKIVREIPVNHPRVFDPSGSLVTSRISADNGDTRTSRGTTFLLPYHILASSDGKVRWHGFVAASRQRQSEWEAALDTILRVDPGIKARREAEQEYIHTKND